MSTAPKWRLVKKGLNLCGKCVTPGCDAQNKQIWIPYGIGVFNINKLVHISKCPCCQKEASEVDNIGYYCCNVEFFGKVKGASECFRKVDTQNDDSCIKTFVN